MKLTGIVSTGILSLGIMVACGDDKKKEVKGEEACSLDDGSGCEKGLVCEATENGEPQCATPLTIRGAVVDTTDSTGIAGALVQAVDPNGAAVGTSAKTAADGTYSLTVPSTRDANGAPIAGAYTLRAQAAGYQKFPSGMRQALPLDTKSGAETGGTLVIENALSTIGLIPLPGTTADLGAVTGTIVADACDGVLVVAESQTAVFTGYSDADCAYTIFNVSAGTYSVRGYAAGLQLNPAETTVAGAATVTGVDLTASSTALGTVSGTVQFVNASGVSLTSVILTVESTFVTAIAKGETPPGLRAGDVTGAFTIEGVPDGRYIVLAAFENDGLVRDPDETIGGTELLHLAIPDTGGDRTIALEGFKVTGALAVAEPGADEPEAIATLTPTLAWADDSSEDGYELTVFDAFGQEILAVDVARVSGADTVTYSYDGPTFEVGMYYQFRIYSYHDEKDDTRSFISATEDLKGVFYYAP